MKMKHKILPIISALGIIALVFALYAFSGNPNNSKTYIPQTPWENLKVLPQDITKDSLIGLMKNYETSLGVRCNYCHMPSKTDPSKLDFPNDGKIEKEIARGMIAMTNEINEKHFKPYFPDPKPSQVYVVNCVMCHRGNSNPEKYLSQMNSLMYKTYDPDRDNRKEKELDKQGKK